MNRPLWGVRNVLRRRGKLDKVVWDDVNVEASALSLGAVAPDIITLFSSGGIRGIAFDGNNTAESLHGGDELFHSYKEGSLIAFHVHWRPTTTNLGNVKWNLEWVQQNVDGLEPTPVIISAIDSADGNAWQHLAVEFPDIVGTGYKVGGHMEFRLFRDPSDPQDTYPDDANLISVGWHYQLDTVGSNKRFTKV